MKKPKTGFMIITFVCYVNLFGDAAITNDKCGGRLGDQLLLYTKAKWLAYNYNLRFFLRSFKYSDSFMLDFWEEKYDVLAREGFKRNVDLRMEERIENNKNDSVLYRCNFYCQLKTDLFKTIIKDKEFAEILKRLISPKHDINIDLPKNMITVAIHVRKGNSDWPLASQQIFKKYADKVWPSKFPPEQFYIDQLNILYKLLGEQGLYVFIFTDQNPHKIIENFKEQSPHSNIIFDCRSHGILSRESIIEDMWHMSKFDCLIRPKSAYSIIAQFIGNHKIIIEPWASHWENTRLIIDQARAVVPNRKDKIVEYFSHDSDNNHLKYFLNEAFPKINLL